MIVATMCGQTLTAVRLLSPDDFFTFATEFHGIVRSTIITLGRTSPTPFEAAQWKVDSPAKPPT
ncbi:MAG: hypothetical protein ABI673_02640 [Novosphingobium sp.]